MVSVIVPIYNVEKYLRRCVDSIIEQTYRDFELILVDDGSPDNCPIICDEYAQKYEFITVVHKKNGGLSDARNAGTKNARGQYVTYIDSDDFVSKDYLQSLVELIFKYNAEIAVGGIYTFYDDKHIKLKSVDEKTYCYNGLDALKNMLYQNNLDSSACAMVILKSIALQYPFPYGKYHEDEFTTYKYYLYANKVAISTKPIYYYYQRQDSIMHVFGQASMDELDAADNYESVCKQYSMDLLKAAQSKKFSDYCQVLLSSKIEELDTHTYTRIKNYLLSSRKQILLDKNSRTKNRIAAASLFLGINGLNNLNKLYSGIKKIRL